MINKLIIPLLLITTFSFAHDKKYAVDIGVGLGIAEDLYYPISTLSFYWLKEKGIHQLSSELLINDNHSTKEYKSQFGFGIDYSFLFRLPIKVWYVGPSLGFNMYTSDKAVKNSRYGTSPYIDYPEYLNEYSNALYLLGAKTAILLGTGTIRCKIDDRLLLGLEVRKKEYVVMNNINVTIMLAF